VEIFPLYGSIVVSDFHCCAEKKPHTASLVLHHGELAEFDVLFKPTLACRVEGKIRLSVVDNPYKETTIQLVGEGYEDDFTLDNIYGLAADSKEENTEGNVEEDVTEGKTGCQDGARNRKIHISTHLVLVQVWSSLSGQILLPFGAYRAATLGSTREDCLSREKLAG